jgi:tetratricopeptide (TPR) repeat protein
MLIFLWVFPSATLARKFLNWQVVRLTPAPALTPSEALDLAAALNRAAKLEERTRAKIVLPPTTSQRLNEAVTFSALRSPEGPFIDAAAALGNYSRLTASEPARSSADELLDKVLGPVEAGTTNTLDHSDAEAAISALTRTIELSVAELKGKRLMQRGFLFSFLGKPDEALRDFQAAQQLGVVDLGDLAWGEALALAYRGRPGDLRKAIDWINLAIKLPASTQGLPPGSGPFVRAEQLRLRGTIFVKLDDNSGALRAFLEYLGFVKGNYLPYQLRRQAYLDAITTYLRLGQREDALKIAAEWQRESGDPLAVSAHLVLETNDASQALAQILAITR